jgi:hypothetical protein
LKSLVVPADVVQKRVARAPLELDGLALGALGDEDVVVEPHLARLLGAQQRHVRALLGQHVELDAPQLKLRALAFVQRLGGLPREELDVGVHLGGARVGAARLRGEHPPLGAQVRHHRLDRAVARARLLDSLFK